jgi:hypothetical protein
MALAPLRHRLGVLVILVVSSLRSANRSAGSVNRLANRSQTRSRPNLSAITIVADELPAIPCHMVSTPD